MRVDENLLFYDMVLMVINMIEINKFLNSEKIDNMMHNRTINNKNFNMLTQKIISKDYEKIINQIYWLSLVLYRISFTSYNDNLSKDSVSYLSRNNILIYYPFSIFSSEICRIVKSEYIYTSLLSTIARQIIEQICSTKEIEAENVSNGKILEAMMESHNKHIGVNSLNIEWINFNNEGILKVFKTGRKYGNLAKKYNYHFLYNFYSGDIHHISTLNKITPQLIWKENEYNEKYLKVLLGLIKDAISFVNNYCKLLTKEDINKLNSFDFIRAQD